MAAVGRQEPRGVKSVLHPEAMARLVEVAVDRVLGDAEATPDLLGAQMIMDQPQALALARRELHDGRTVRLMGLAHKPS